MSGRISLYICRTASLSRRSYFSRVGTRTSRAPTLFSFSTTYDPRKPVPPVTTTRRLLQKSGIDHLCQLFNREGFSPQAGEVTLGQGPWAPAQAPRGGLAPAPRPPDTCAHRH